MILYSYPSEVAAVVLALLSPDAKAEMGSKLTTMTTARISDSTFFRRDRVCV